VAAGGGGLAGAGGMAGPDARPLIVGAGPVGLGAALFLANRGLSVRLVEVRTEPSEHSKALAVNPRTLEILEASGVTRRMLARGLPIHGARFHRRGRVLGELTFAGIHPRYPFMLALSQAATERLLEEALAEAGGAVERGVELVGCRNLEGVGVEAELQPAGGGPVETVQAPWLLGADGIHSVAREQLAIDFPGSAFPGEWTLADAPVRTSLAPDRAHAFFLSDGAFLFLIRVVEDRRRERPGAPLWRLISNQPDPLSQLVDAEPAGPPVWISTFEVSHRLAARFSAAGVHLAGDAAHVHSPVGARGMNLGLEDAWVFAQLAAAGRLQDYGHLRRPVDRKVVHQVRRLSSVAAGEGALARLAGETLFPLAIKIPAVRSRMLRTVTGLDHELPRLDRAV
jgi:2-polyprenyl-6-methoxyphenol hydroxylase-like FAD-dependent oxidoreductase